MTTKQPHHRRRGVRASREKLIHALTKGGFRTQAALANRIADLEGLDAAPKDLVNRAFREQSVDLQTLDRIATALGVPVHTLYKTSDEVSAKSSKSSDQSQVKTSTDETTTSPSRSFLSVVALTAIVMALIFAVYTWVQPQNENPTSTDTGLANTETKDTALALGPMSVVVLPFTLNLHDAAHTEQAMEPQAAESTSNQPSLINVSKPDPNMTRNLSDSVRAILANDFNVATATAVAVAQSTEARDAATKLRADVVLEGDLVVVGSFVGLRVYMFHNDVRRQIWAQSMPTTQVSEQRDEISIQVLQALQFALDPISRNTPEPNHHFPVAEAQDAYLEGMFHLQKPSTELNIRRAQSRFSAALRQDKRYARAHAGLCLALLDEFWMNDEQRALNDAAQTCGDATNLAPEDAMVMVSNAYFLRRSGQSEAAIEQYEKALNIDPNNTILLDSLASALLDGFRQSGDEQLLKRAVSSAERATEISPLAWRPYNTLLIMQWFAGNVDGAIAAAESAISLEENELALVNLGSLYLCSGQFAQAQTTYERAIEIAPESYQGPEFLGQAMYYLGDFKRSAQLRQQAIESIGTGTPEIHEMWGNLGDSYRQVGNNSGAIGAYLQAAKIAERDHLRGSGAIADRAARAYYYVMLHHLDRDTVTPQVYDTVLNELDEISEQVTETSALRRVAQIWSQLGQTKKAQVAFTTVTATCPGYGRSPDLIHLAKTAIK